ncbi:DUF2193 family protein [Candidatus Bathyarchaeota archaeon]|nr:DUF2193 family protein [Candidatus Bathyarchaeota archaeon]
MENQLAEKIADEIVSLQRTWVQIVKEKRGGQFEVSDWRPMLQVKNRLVPSRKQSKDVFDLYVVSANAGYSVISSLTEFVLPEDEPWLEHYQTTAVFEILYEFDKDFKRASVKVAQAIDKSHDLIQEEIFSRFYGRYGPTWIADYVPTPGSFSNLYMRILNNVDIKTEYKWAFINAVSAARNTSYSVMFGSRFFDILDDNKDIHEAISAEKEIMKDMWLNPIETQVRIMKEIGHKSFDYKKCLEMFKEKIFKATVKAAKAGVHYANLSLIPLWSAGDFHHVSQTTYNLCKSDIEMAILESLTHALENTIEKAKLKHKLKNPYEIPASEVTAAGAAYIMQLDGFTSEMLNDLFLKRFYNLLLKNPKKFRYECMNGEFVNFLTRGEHYIEKPPVGLGGQIYGITIDLSAIDDNEVLQNPQRYGWPECPITTRFAGLLRFADEPFHLISDPLICLYATELIALNPSEPYLPFLYCKQCALAKLLPYRCKYCLAKRRMPPKRKD